MSSVTFSIQNPDKDNKAIILLGKKNTLNFVFEVTDSQFVKDDTITLNIPKDLLQSPDALKFSSTDWLPASPVVKSDTYQLLFTYQGTQLEDASTYTLKLEEWEPAKVVSNESITTKYILNGSPLGGTSEVLNVKKSNSDLSKLFSFSTRINDVSLYPDLKGSVWISPTDNQKKISVPIANTIALDMDYQGTFPLVSGWDKNNPPTFKLWFEYGDTADDLTDKTLAVKIVSAVESSQSANWAVQKENNGQWLVTPIKDTNVHLFTAKDILSIDFSQIITVLPHGLTKIWLSWKNFPQYDDGQTNLEIEKLKGQSKIYAFNGPSDPVIYNQLTELKGIVFALAKVNLQVASNDSTKPTSEDWTFYEEGDEPQLVYNATKKIGYQGKGDGKNQPKTTFTANHSNLDPITITWIDFPPPVIESFTAEVQMEEGVGTLIFEWAMTPYEHNTVNMKIVDEQGNNIYISQNATGKYSLVIQYLENLPKKCTLQAASYSIDDSEKVTLAIDWGQGQMIKDGGGNLSLSKKGDRLFIDSPYFLVWRSTDSPNYIVLGNIECDTTNTSWRLLGISENYGFGLFTEGVYRYPPKGLITYFDIDDSPKKTPVSPIRLDQITKTAFWKNRVFLGMNTNAGKLVSFTTTSQEIEQSIQFFAVDALAIVNDLLFIYADFTLYYVRADKFSKGNLKKIECQFQPKTFYPAGDFLYFSTLDNALYYIDIKELPNVTIRTVDLPSGSNNNVIGITATANGKYLVLSIGGDYPAKPNKFEILATQNPGKTRISFPNPKEYTINPSVINNAVQFFISLSDDNGTDLWIYRPIYK